MLEVIGVVSDLSSSGALEVLRQSSVKNLFNKSEVVANFVSVITSL